MDAENAQLGSQAVGASDSQIRRDVDQDIQLQFFYTQMPFHNNEFIARQVSLLLYMGLRRDLQHKFQIQVIRWFVRMDWLQPRVLAAPLSTI
jgi:hypothetical protein